MLPLFYLLLPVCLWESFCPCCSPGAGPVMAAAVSGLAVAVGVPEAAVEIPAAVSSMAEAAVISEEEALQGTGNETSYKVRKVFHQRRKREN